MVVSLDRMVEREKYYVDRELRRADEIHRITSRIGYAKHGKDAASSLRTKFRNPRISAQREVYGLMKIYCRKAFGDLEGDELDKKTGKIELPDKPEGESYEELRQDLISRLVLGHPQLTELPQKANEDYECLAYHLLAIIDNTKGDGEETRELAQNYFPSFLKAYCKAHEDSLPDELKGNNVAEKEPEIRKFILDTSEHNPIMHIMLIKYYELCGDREAALEVCDRAVIRFNQEHWFIYKYAENVGKTFDGDEDNSDYKNAELLITCLKTMADHKGDPIESNNTRWQQKMGDFFFDTATEPEDFKKAVRHYKAAEKQNGFEKDASLGEKIGKTERCAQAADVVNKRLKQRILTSIPLYKKHWLKRMMFGRTRKDMREEAHSDWGIIKINFDVLLGKLEEEHYYIEHVRKQMSKWFAEYKANRNARIRHCKNECELLERKMIALENELGQAISDADAELIEGEKVDTHRQLSKRTARLELYEAELRPMEESFFEAVGGEDKFKEFRARVARKNDKS